MPDISRLSREYSQVCQALKAHKRAAENIKEQLNGISCSVEELESAAISELCDIVSRVTHNLDRLSRLSLLRSYLQQSEIIQQLDELSGSCRKYAESCDDDILLESIESQHEIYEADRKADSINLKKLLRECLRQEDIRLQVLDLAEHEFFSFKNALQLEISLGKGRSDTTRLYQEFLLQIEPLWSGKSGALQDLTNEIVRTSEAPIAWGAACAVWLGELYGKKVVLHTSPKQFKPKSEDIVILKNSISWAKFDHPNVLKLIGVYRQFRNHGLALVSPYMSNGTVGEFLRVNPGADRLKLIDGIAAGLAYLHSRQPPYIHGILTGNGVMVDDNCNAVVGGLATPTFEDGWLSPLRWLAPELVNEYRRCDKSKAADVYSFAMTIYEIVVRQVPYGEHRSPREVITMVERGERPDFGDGRLLHHSVDAQLRLLISQCWMQDPEARPSIADVHQLIVKLRKAPTLNVTDLTDQIEPLEDVRSIYASGGFGDVRRALLRGFGPVALKTLVVRGKTRPVLKSTKRFMREASIWSELHHPNIVPFLGTADLPELDTCLVSPWMFYGNCMNYLEKQPAADSLVLPIARGVAYGLQYLHEQSPPVIHGDLRGANVLIDNQGEPLLADFGLAVIVEDLTQMPISSALEGSGNPRWMAPELLVGQEIVSKPSDIWSLGMFFLELITLDVPFRELKSYPQVILAIHSNRRPERPTCQSEINRGLLDRLWNLMEWCWAQEKSRRPTAAEISKELQTMNSTASEDMEGVESTIHFDSQNHL